MSPEWHSGTSLLPSRLDPRQAQLFKLALRPMLHPVSKFLATSCMLSIKTGVNVPSIVVGVGLACVLMLNLADWPCPWSMSPGRSGAGRGLPAMCEKASSDEHRKPAHGVLTFAILSSAAST